MNAASVKPLVISDLGTEHFSDTWARMKAFTESRTDESSDELWFVEHPPVFTLGLAGDEGHILDAAGIEVVRTDRGGQVTYHGPGQLVCYTLLDLRRRQLDVRSLVQTLEAAVIRTVHRFGVEAYGRRDAPGVYVSGSKLAAVGLRVRRGCSYHGIALNVAMDLTPYSQINPCGYAGMNVTQLSDLADVASVDDVRPTFERELSELLQS